MTFGSRLARPADSLAKVNSQLYEAQLSLEAKDRYQIRQLVEMSQITPTFGTFE